MSADTNKNRILVDETDDNGNIEHYKRFKTRYLLPDSSQITEEEYNLRKGKGETVFKGCFVGVFYMVN